MFIFCYLIDNTTLPSTWIASRPHTTSITQISSFSTLYIYTRYKTPDGKRGQSVYLYVFFFIKKCALPAYQLDLTYTELHYRENKLGEDNILLDRWQIRHIFSSLDHAYIFVDIVLVFKLINHVAI